MKASFIRQRPDFNVISYGNGLAYALERKPSYQSVYFQGDDAESCLSANMKGAGHE